MTASLIFCWLFAKIMTSLLEVVRCVQKGSIKMQPWKWTKDMATTYSHLSKDLITDLGQSIKANANGTGLQTGFCQWHPIHKFQSVSLCLESVENARYNFFYLFPVSHNAGVMCFCHYVNTSNPDSLGRWYLPMCATAALASFIQLLFCL